MRKTGKIKWFNTSKGFGFITADDDGQEIFVHFTAVKGDAANALKEGDAVTFEVNESPKGLIATNVIAA